MWPQTNLLSLFFFFFDIYWLDSLKLFMKYIHIKYNHMKEYALMKIHLILTAKILLWNKLYFQFPNVWSNNGVLPWELYLTKLVSD